MNNQEYEIKSGEEYVIATYLDLLERCLLNTIYGDPPQDPWSGGRFRPELRHEGKDWPSQAHTMIGFRRLRQLREACEMVLCENVRGDFIETGVWRGGACILMRGVLAAYGVSNRVVWCADSFEGLPPPSCEQDRGDPHHTFDVLKVSLEEVRENFQRYGLLDDRVRFLKGWFRDTLGAAPIQSLAILRLDGDMYESTTQALDALYDKVSPGGFVIVDDFGAVLGCRRAVEQFRSRHAIHNPLIKIDWGGVYWRKKE
jgi:O-methyltransferase/8-demethyl-8-(2,3-dimethoxy-alpha-L-rhamnosyl)tetracenomycin-C 4'-O-methyltransferase